MKDQDREKLERIEELLGQLQNHFLNTYREIRGIMEELQEEMDREDPYDPEEEEEVDEDLLSHIEEIFGDDEEE